MNVPHWTVEVHCSVCGLDGVMGLYDIRWGVRGWFWKRTEEYWWNCSHCSTGHLIEAEKVPQFVQAHAKDLAA